MLKIPEKKQPLVRVDAADKLELDRLAAKRGESVPKILHRAICALKKQEFFKEMNEGYRNLKNDKAAWEAELSDRRMFEGTLADGLS